MKTRLILFNYFDYIDKKTKIKELNMTKNQARKCSKIQMNEK